MNTRVLYINASFGVKRFMEPLGISYLAAAIRQADIPGLTVELYEPSVEGDSIAEAVKKAAGREWDYIGLSFISDDAQVCRQFIELYREAGGKAWFIVGGHGPSLSPEAFLLPEVKAVFIGEGEVSAPCFFKTVLEGGALASVPGIAFRDKEGRIIRTRSAPRLGNLDELPFMARDVLQELCQKYPGEVSARIISSRGCYMFCEYCSVRAYAKLQEGIVYRERSVDNLIKEMKYLYEVYQVRQFLFEDDNFLPGNPKRAKEKVDYFCDELKKLAIPGIRLHMQCRPDSVTSYVIERLKECGLCDLFIGIENINQKDMDFFGRRSDVKQHLQVMKELEELGFSCDVNAEYRLRIGYITFNPESTRETLLNSVAFLKQYHVTPKKLVNILRPYKHTQIYDKFVEKGYLLEDGTTCFCDSEIGVICDSIVQTVRRFLAFREQVRLPVKLNKELKLGFELDNMIVELDKVRKVCDDKCYQVAEDILRAKLWELPDIINDSILFLEKWKDDLQLNERLVMVKQAMGIETLEAGIYR